MPELTSSQIGLTIAASLFSGLVGLGISTWHYRRYERRKTKWETLKMVLSNRYDLLGDEFSRGMNEVMLVFNGSAPVMAALTAFHEKVVTRQESEDAMLVLLKAMCRDLGVDHARFNDSFFLRPFNARASSTGK